MLEERTDSTSSGSGRRSRLRCADLQGFDVPLASARTMKPAFSSVRRWKEQFEGLRAAIEAGTGFAGWHGGIADSYRNTSDYLHLVGGQFACHPGKHPDERVGEQSDNYVPYRIEMLPTAADHPVTAGIGDFDLVTEQYWVLADSYCDVLATTTQAAREWDPWHRPVTSPAVWTRSWGEGRVFVCTPGHDLETLDDPDVRTLVERGLLWASR